MVTAVCMIAIPSGCADEENFFLEESAARNIGTSNNRTPQDAQALAADAFRTFIDSTYVESRSGSIIDYSKPVVILRNPLSRSSESNDTLIYIVNYADDAGYAIIAAPKKVEPVLAVVHEGSFNEDLNDPSAHSPGFLMWLDNTMSIIGGGDLIDSIPNDDDLHAEPIPDLAQVKEYNETNGKDIHHAWICDGVYRVRYYHVLETKSNLSSQWTVTRTGPVDLTRLHFNWGWNGTDNGWFWHTPINLSKSTYNKFEYIVVSHS